MAQELQKQSLPPHNWLTELAGELSKKFIYVVEVEKIGCDRSSGGVGEGLGEGEGRVLIYSEGR